MILDLVSRSFVTYLDTRLLDLVTDPVSYLDLDAYHAWRSSKSPAGHRLDQLWTSTLVRDAVAASWQDACRDHGVPHAAEDWRAARIALLHSWGVSP